MKIGLTLSIIAVCLFFWSCKGSKKTTDTPTDTTVIAPENKVTDMSKGTGLLLVEMSKSACFGKCPVYTVKVFDNGRVEYSGVMHTDKLGVFSKTLDENSFYQIVDNLKRTNLAQFEDFYSSGATDFPITSITHYRGDSTKSVKGDFERPAPVKALEKQLELVANNGEWIQEEMQVPYAAIENEIIVELNPDFNAEELEKDFSEYDLKVKNKIAPNLNLWVYHFDTMKVKPGRMAILLKKHEATKEIDFNKKLDSRK